MTELLQLEPRVAGPETLEPPADFTAEGSWVNMHDRARCPQTIHGPTIHC
jgi:hypothetical protein